MQLIGDLTVPPVARGLVLFAHGSGSSRHSSRNRFVADELNGAGLATLLFDLLTEQEEIEEPGTLEQVAEFAHIWFVQHLNSP